MLNVLIKAEELLGLFLFLSFFLVSGQKRVNNTHDITPFVKDLQWVFF